MSSKPSTSMSCEIITKVIDERPKDCLRCKKIFQDQNGLYKHLWCNKTDCNEHSDISIEEAKKHANPPDYYKCSYCSKVIIDKKEREEHKLNCDKKDLIDTLEFNNINPIISYLFISDENGKVISNVDKETGYINGTLMCKSVGKEINKFIKLDSTIELVNEIKKYNNLWHLNDEIELPSKDYFQSLIIQKPSLLNLNVIHTYIHEQIAIELAGWCDTKYKIILYNFIIKFKNGLVKTEDSVKTKQDIENINNGKITLSSCTNYSNKYDPQVYFISFDFDFKNLNAIYFNTNKKNNEIVKFDKTSGIIIKCGNQKKHSTRQGNHDTTFDKYKLLDTVKCYDHDNLEKYIHKIYKDNRIEIIEPNKIKGTEYFYFENQEEYNQMVEDTIEKAEDLNKKLTEDLYGNNKELDIKKEETKQKELEIEQLKIKENIKQTDLEIERQKTIQEINRQNNLKLQLKLQRLQNGSKYTIKKEDIIESDDEEEKIIPPKKVCENNKFELIIQDKKFKFKEHKKLFKGIDEWKGEKSYYRVTVCHDKKRSFVGSYKDLKLACVAYDCKCKLVNKELYYNIKIPDGYTYNEKSDLLVKII
jgi:KilA-N domain